VNSNCPLAALLSKLDHAKLPEEILPHIAALEGTARHRLALQRPWRNYQGRGEIPIFSYAERDVFVPFPNVHPQPGEQSNIVVAGRLDAALCLHNGNPTDDVLVILDYKRARHIRPTFEIQERLYRLGVEHVLGRKFKRAVLIIAHNPVFAEEDELHFPIYNIVLDTEDRGAWTFDLDCFQEQPFSTLAEYATHQYQFQRKLLDRRVFLQYLAKARSTEGCCFQPKKPGTCGHPFAAPLCTLATTLVQKGKDLRTYLLDGMTI
jgi:hypothetical protein